MNSPETISKPNSFKMLQSMVGIGALCGLLIVLTYEGTLPRIEKLKEEALQQAIFRVIPGITATQAFSYENGVFTVSNGKGDNTIYAGYDESGTFKGVAIEASGQGYADIIRVLYGYDPEKQAIVGFYVLESKETPGLGDKIEKDPNFLDNFSLLDVTLTDDLSTVQHRIATVKSGAKSNPWEVDGITGATISSRAIGEILGNSTSYWIPIIYKHQAVIKDKANE